MSGIEYTRLSAYDNWQVLWFLDRHPLRTAAKHWVYRAGRKSFACLDHCPLCAYGHKPTPADFYAVMNLTNSRVEVLEAKKPMRLVLATFDADLTGPLNRMPYAMRKVGETVWTNLLMRPLKDADLNDDFGVDPNQARAVVAAAQAPDPVLILPRDTREDLIALVQELRETA